MAQATETRETITAANETFMSHKSANKSYDVILIGSGIGGLACASLLAQRENKRVLVLERHFKIGGFTQTFKRKGKFEWDVGVHYIGKMHPGSNMRDLFDFITQGKVKWQNMPQTYDRFVYPDFTFDAQMGKERLQQDLITRFPQEAKAIQQYFMDIESAMGWFNRYVTVKLMTGMGMVSNLVNRYGAKLALQTTKEYLDTHFRDPQLKAVLVSQWGTYGLPPSQSAFVIHALIADHYFEGGYYPVGGSKVIADSIIPIIERAGGQALVNHTVTKILVQGGRAIGVRVQAKKGKQITEKEFYANAIVSDVGAWITYNELLEEQPFPFRDSLDTLPIGVANVALYVGFKDTPRHLGVQGENYWFFSSYDHDASYDSRNELLDGLVSSCFLSFPSLKNPKAETHTAEIIAFVDSEPFRRWIDQPWFRRDEDYGQLKASISAALIDFTDQRLPGFKELVDYQELSTPLSTVSFTGHRSGAIYGLPATPMRYRLDWLGVRTPLRNLFLAGADASSLGVMGAVNGGVLAASLVSGDPSVYMKIFKEAREYSQRLAK